MIQLNHLNIPKVEVMDKFGQVLKDFTSMCKTFSIEPKASFLSMIS